MSKKKILICDDDKRRVEDWELGLRKRKLVSDKFVVKPLTQDELQENVSVLEDRRRKARKNITGDLKGTAIDSAAILVVDYDLIDLFPKAYFTGEDLAYLARCYSRCGVIVGLNQFGDNFFDLNLSGNPESFADLNIGGTQLNSIGLWQHPWSGFRPWLWPLLPAATLALERRVRAISKDMDRPVVDILKLPTETMNGLSRTAAQFLGKSDEPESATVREFAMNSDQGFRRKDKPFSEVSIARIAASRLSKWLERFVLSGQDILVDAPHLVSRYPSLLKEPLSRKAAWDATTKFGGIKALGIHDRWIESDRYKANDWLSRPVWFLDKVRENSKLAEVEDPWSTPSHRFVFCEDISQFLEGNQAREFVADLDSPFARRYVADPSSGISGSLQQSLAGIEYRPQVRFAI